MKYLKIFEENSNGKWSLGKIEELYDDMANMSSLICQYLFTNKFIIQPKNKEPYHYNLEEFWFDGEGDESFFSVSYKESIQFKPHTFNYDFTKQQFDDLIEFMNDPEMYKNAGKYNL